jgi:pimeloyl-ACP methyl ester carboxylesterase
MTQRPNRITGELEEVGGPSPSIAHERIQLADGEEIAYVTSGHGPVDVLFVHGWLSSGMYWLPVIRRMPAGQYRCWAPDLPGFGRSGPAVAESSFSRMAAAVRRFAEQLDLRDVVLVGHSMGGSTALVMAASHDPRIGNLVLEGVTADPPTGASVEVLLERVRKKGASESLLRAVINSWFLEIAPDDFDFMLRGARRVSRETFLSSLEAIAAGAGAKAANEVNIPTLIAFGVHDQIREFSQMVELNEAICNSHLFVVEKSAHTPHYDNPGKFTWLIRTWLEQGDAFDTVD